jgi:hypothetical protein
MLISQSKTWSAAATHVVLDAMVASLVLLGATGLRRLSSLDAITTQVK